MQQQRAVHPPVTRSTFHVPVSSLQTITFQFPDENEAFSLWIVWLDCGFSGEHTLLACLPSFSQETVVRVRRLGLTPAKCLTRILWRGGRSQCRSFNPPGDCAPPPPYKTAGMWSNPQHTHAHMLTRTVTSEGSVRAAPGESARHHPWHLNLESPYLTGRHHTEARPA